MNYNFASLDIWDEEKVLGWTQAHWHTNKGWAAADKRCYKCGQAHNARDCLGVKSLTDPVKGSWAY